MISILVLKMRGKDRAFGDYRELLAALQSSDAAAKQFVDHRDSARGGRFEPGETAIRVTWTKPTRRYSSKPVVSLVEVGDDDFSPEFVVTTSGEQVARKTLYRVPIFEESAMWSARSVAR
jgi:hypothetical protein